MRTAIDPDHTILLNEAISCYEICSNDFAYNLICVAKKKHLSLILVSLPASIIFRRYYIYTRCHIVLYSDLQEESGEFMWNHIQDLELTEKNARCRAIAFSPDTSLNCTPNKVTICAAIGQRDLKLFHSDLNEYNTEQTLRGHKDYVNDIAWVCDGDLLASVSDDFTCKFWNTSTNFENDITFCLSSAGMSVKSHPEDPNKVLVAEKRGKVPFRLYMQY